jgi:hypothetical protein
MKPISRKSFFAIFVAPLLAPFLPKAVAKIVNPTSEPTASKVFLTATEVTTNKRIGSVSFYSKYLANGRTEVADRALALLVRRAVDSGASHYVVTWSDANAQRAYFHEKFNIPLKNLDSMLGKSEHWLSRAEFETQYPL